MKNERDRRNASGDTNTFVIFEAFSTCSKKLGCHSSKRHKSNLSTHNNIKNSPNCNILNLQSDFIKMYVTKKLSYHLFVKICLVYYILITLYL